MCGSFTEQHKDKCLKLPLIYKFSLYKILNGKYSTHDKSGKRLERGLFLFLLLFFFQQLDCVSHAC